MRTPELGNRTALALAVAIATGVLGSTAFANTATEQAVEEKLAPSQAALPADTAKLIGEDGRLAVFVEFSSAATSQVYADQLMSGGGEQVPGAVLRANEAAQLQLQRINASQQSFLNAIGQLGVAYDELYRAARSINGMALRVTPDQIPLLRQLENVKRVEVMFPDELDNASSTPFIGSPSVWSALNLPRGSTGQNIKIGIIDTGIDYQHAHFGGTGLLADYQANDRTVITDQIGGNPIFPTVKVVGGRDFAGDAYTGSNTPVPDSDPMDCDGHGTHVAGSAAGLGVTTAGATYAGAYDNNIDYSSFRIGPGVAPQASLYALRVFGCTGSTNLTVSAIEWAMDPNGDGNFSDRLDVINMSLGSNFGDAFNASSIASDNAAKVGVVVVASAGNANDTFFISGSPGASGRTISVASILDSGISVPLVRVNSPAALSGNKVAGTASFGVATSNDGLTGDFVLAVDGTAPANDGCETLTNAADVAGKIVLIDRGTCAFQIKANNAEAAGAAGVIIVNNAAGAPPGMAVTAGLPAVTIPVLSITLDDGNAIKASLASPGVNGTMLSGAPGSDTPSSFTSRGPRRASPVVELKPDLAAPGQSITSAQTGITGPTSFADGNQSLTISGTSMAAPHVAGVMALLRDLHPNMSVEELKALAMNTSLHDVTTLPGGQGLRLGGSRIGAGRIDAHLAAQGNVVAFNEENDGLVSISFESGVRGVINRSKTVRLVNHGSQAQTYALGIDTIVDASGVSFGTNVNQITVPANGSATFSVTMDANAAQMKNDRDPTVAATQAPSASTVSATVSAAIARHFLSEESALLTLSQGGQTKLRLPVYAAVYPESSISADDVISTGGLTTGSASIALSGQGVCSGSLAGSTCTKANALDQASLVSPFELQGVSPRATSVDPARDIRYVGVAYDTASDRLNFGLASWGPWSSPTDVSYRIDIDCGVYTLVSSLTTDTCTGAPDGIYDLRVVATNRGTFNLLLTGASTSGIDVFQVIVIGLATGRTSSLLVPANTWVNSDLPSANSTRLELNSVQILPVPRSTVKVSGAFRYRVSTCFGLSPTCTGESDSIGPLNWNYLAQGVNFSGSILRDAQAGGTVPLTFNTTNMTTNGSLGALLLHHFNGEGARAELAVLQGANVADGSVALSVNNNSATVGSVVTVTATVTNGSSTQSITGASVNFELPGAVTVLGDNGGGAYDSSTKVWTAGTLTPGQSKTLNVLLRVDGSGPQQVRAMMDATAPVDGNLANNHANVTINASAAADLAASITSGPSSVVSNTGTMTFNISVSNSGPDQAFNVNVSELFVAGGLEPLAPTSATPSVGNYNGTTGVWSIPSMSATATAPTLSLTFAVPTVTGLTNATLRVNAVSETADPSSANNVANRNFVILPVRVFTNGFED